MGALPKRKISKARKGRRRAHDHLKPINVQKCPRCGKPMRSHFECQYCGFYAKDQTKTK